MIHLTTHQLSSYLDRELPESSTELVRRHLDACEECTRRFAAVSEQEAVLNRVLVHEPDAFFFAGFAGRVMGTPAAVPKKTHAPEHRKGDGPREAERRITERRVAERRGTPEPVAVDRRIEDRRAPEERRDIAPAAQRREIPPAARKFVPTPEPATAVTRRSDPVPNPAPQVAQAAIPSRRERSRSAPAVPWFAALALCLVVGAIAYVLPRPLPRMDERSDGPAPETERAPQQAPAPAPDETPSSAPQRAPEGTMAAPRVSAGSERTPVPETPLVSDGSVVPVRRFLTTTETVPAAPRTNAVSPPASAPAPKAEPDPFANAPQSALPLISAARDAARAASLDSSSANLDAVGDAWDRAVPALSGTPQTLARAKLAEARYHAWAAAPDPYRVSNATAALRTYLVFAPPGPERDRVRAWLSRIR